MIDARANKTVIKRREKMKAEWIMNTTTKWIKVVNSKEAGTASGNVYNTLSDAEKKAAQNIMGYRKTNNEQGVFFVTDSDLSRKLFAGFFTESEAIF